MAGNGNYPPRHFCLTSSATRVPRFLFLCIPPRRQGLKWGRSQKSGSVTGGRPHLSGWICGSTPVDKGIQEGLAKRVRSEISQFGRTELGWLEPPPRPLFPGYHLSAIPMPAFQLPGSRPDRDRGAPIRRPVGRTGMPSLLTKGERRSGGSAGGRFSSWWLVWKGTSPFRGGRVKIEERP